MSLLERMPHTMSLFHVSYDQDDLGGDVQTRAATAYQVGMACWVQPAGQREINEFKKRDQNVSHRVYLTTNPYSIGLRLSDQIDVLTGPYAGHTLTVRAFGEDSAGAGILYLIYAETDREGLT